MSRRPESEYQLPPETQTLLRGKSERKLEHYRLLGAATYLDIKRGTSPFNDELFAAEVMDIEMYVRPDNFDPFVNLGLRAHMAYKVAGIASKRMLQISRELTALANQPA